MAKISYYVLIVLAALGTLAGGRLSLAHMQTGETCPTLGPIPACLIVFIGYALVLISVTIGPKAKRKLLFFIGWTPVFALAAFGVSLEIFGQDICPIGALGIPQCFYSFAMVLLCLLLFLLWQKDKKT